MSKLMISLFAAAGIAFAGTAVAQTSMSRATYKTEIDKAEAQYKADSQQCASMSGNAKDLCRAEAKGKERVAKADADATYKNTAKARYDARLARADASYGVAKEKCDDRSGNPRDVCVKEAKAAYVKAKADAKVAKVSSDAMQSAEAKKADVRQVAGGHPRCAIPGGHREVRRDERRREGSVRARRQAALRQVVVRLTGARVVSLTRWRSALPSFRPLPLAALSPRPNVGPG